MQQASYYNPKDELSYQFNSLKPFLIAVAALLILLFVGLRLMPEQGSPLIAKVMSLLCPTLMAAAGGTYLGRNLYGWGWRIGLVAAASVWMVIVMALSGAAIRVPVP